MKKILIDSDICLDSITNRIPFSVDASRLLEAVEEKKCTGIISAESFSKIYYILRKLSNRETAIRQIRNLRKITQPGAILPSTLDKAIELDWPDFEDALQYASALENECDAIVSRNVVDFKKSKIPVMNAGEFLLQKGL